MVDRPIINTRDEPHADEKQYRRFHVIVGDANMAEMSSYLKIGTAILMLQMIEDGIIGNQFRLRDPVAAIKSISRDLTCKRTIKLSDGSERSPIELQRVYQRLAAQYVEDRKSDNAYYEIDADVVKKWGETLDKLDEDPMQLNKELDWVIKYTWLKAYRARHEIEWRDHRIAMLGLQYHDIRANVGVFYRLQKAGHVRRVVSQEAIIHAISNPPLDTRAYFRGTCLKQFASEIHAASWNSLIFDVEGKSLQKVPMQYPLRGTREMVGDMIKQCKSAADLLAAIEAKPDNSE